MCFYGAFTANTRRNVNYPAHIVNPCHEWLKGVCQVRADSETRHPEQTVLFGVTESSLVCARLLINADMLFRSLELHKAAGDNRHDQKTG